MTDEQTPAFEYVDDFSHVKLTLVTLDNEGTAQLTLFLDEDAVHVALTIEIGDEAMPRLRDYITARAGDYDAVETERVAQYQQSKADAEAELARRAFATNSHANTLRGRFIGTFYTVHLRTCPVVTRNGITATTNMPADNKLTALADVLHLVSDVGRSANDDVRFCQRCNPLGARTAAVNRDHSLRPALSVVEDALIAADHAYRVARTTNPDK